MSKIYRSERAAWPRSYRVSYFRRESQHNDKELNILSLPNE